MRRPLVSIGSGVWSPLGQMNCSGFARSLRTSSQRDAVTSFHCTSFGPGREIAIAGAAGAVAGAVEGGAMAMVGPIDGAVVGAVCGAGADAGRDGGVAMFPSAAAPVYAT